MFQIFEAERTSNEDTYDPILPPVMLRAETSDMHWEPIGYAWSSTGLGVQTQSLPLWIMIWFTSETPVIPSDSSPNPVGLEILFLIEYQL